MKTNGDDLIHSFQGPENFHINGLNKREYFAAMAMQEMVHKVGIDSMDLSWMEQAAPNIAKAACKMADALIEALND